MLQASLKAGTEIRLNCGVKQLIVEGGRVTGVVAQKDGAEWRIGAHLGVLINAGGFARNQRMLDQYIPGTSADWSNVIAEDMGDMIEEGVRIGAAIAQMGERIGMPVGLPPGKPKATMANDVAKPHCITVDQAGVRYMNEAGSSVEYCREMLERNKQTPAVPSWMVFDSQYVNKYMLAGTMPAPRNRRHGSTRSSCARPTRCRISPLRAGWMRPNCLRLSSGSMASQDAVATRTSIGASMSTSNGRAIRCVSLRSHSARSSKLPFMRCRSFQAT